MQQNYTNTNTPKISSRPEVFHKFNFSIDQNLRTTYTFFAFMWGGKEMQRTVLSPTTARALRLAATVFALEPQRS